MSGIEINPIETPLVILGRHCPHLEFLSVSRSTCITEDAFSGMLKGEKVNRDTFPELRELDISFSRLDRIKDWTGIQSNRVRKRISREPAALGFYAHLPKLRVLYVGTWTEETIRYVQREHTEVFKDITIVKA